MKIILFIFMLQLFVFNAQAQSHCSWSMNNKMEPQLKQLLNDLDPFWGTWRGQRGGDSVVAEIRINNQNQFVATGHFKNIQLNNKKIKICLHEKGLQAFVSGLFLDIQIINKRQLRVTNSLLKKPIDVQR